MNCGIGGSVQAAVSGAAIRDMLSLAVTDRMRREMTDAPARARTLSATDTLTAGDLLPGFALPLGEVFGG